jgi:hypothetical protein
VARVRTSIVLALGAARETVCRELLVMVVLHAFCEDVSQQSVKEKCRLLRGDGWKMSIFRLGDKR